MPLLSKRFTSICLPALTCVLRFPSALRSALRASVLSFFVRPSTLPCLTLDLFNPSHSCRTVRTRSSQSHPINAYVLFRLHVCALQFTFHCLFQVLFAGDGCQRQPVSSPTHQLTHSLPLSLSLTLSLLPASSLIRFAFCVLGFAFCVLHFAFCILRFAFPLRRSACSLVCSSRDLAPPRHQLPASL